MRTTNKTTMSNKNIMADRTLFGSVGRIDIDNPTSFFGGFILNEGLQLPERPFMNPPIPFGFTFPNVKEILLNDNISLFNTINDSLTYIMVSPCHEPSPSTRDFPEQSLSGFCAFGLKFANQFIMFNPFGLDVFAEELLIGSNSDIIYADINAENSCLQTRDCDINIFSKIKQEETSTFFVNPKQGFFNIPQEVFFVYFWNNEWNLNSPLNSGNTQNFVLERCTSWEIVSDRTSFDDWLGFSLFTHFNSLPATTDDELCLKTSLFEFGIDSVLEFDFVLDFIIPSEINTELQGFLIDFDSLDYFKTYWDFDFNSCSRLHINDREQLIYKNIGNEEKTDLSIQIHPTDKSSGHPLANLR